MGSAFDSWDGVEAAYYMGASTSWEVIWLGITIALCVVSLFLGSRHETQAYSEAEKN